MVPVAPAGPLVVLVAVGGSVVVARRAALAMAAGAVARLVVLVLGSDEGRVTGALLAVVGVVVDGIMGG